MSASPRMKFGVLAAGLSCLLAGLALAQQAPATRQPAIGQSQPAAGQPGINQSERSATQTGRQGTSTAQQYTAQFRGNQPGNVGQNQELEHYLASCLQIKNHAEIKANQFAQQKAQNPEVKQFAQQMVQDHQQLDQKLQQLAGAQAGSQIRGNTGEFGAQPSRSGVRQTQFESSTNTSATTQDANANEGLNAGRPNGQNGALGQLLQIDRQITERCGQMVREELQAKSGPEFDKCYLSAQVGAHVHMLAALEVIGKQSQGELRQIATEAQPIVQQHLDQAKQLLKAQEGNASSATGAQAERQPIRTQR